MFHFSAFLYERISALELGSKKERERVREEHMYGIGTNGYQDVHTYTHTYIRKKKHRILKRPSCQESDKTPCQVTLTLSKLNEASSRELILHSLMFSLPDRSFIAYLEGGAADRQRPTTAASRAAHHSPAPWFPFPRAEGRAIAGYRTGVKVRRHHGNCAGVIAAMMYTDSFGYNRPYILSSRKRIDEWMLLRGDVAIFATLLPSLHPTSHPSLPCFCFVDS